MEKRGPPGYIIAAFPNRVNGSKLTTDSTILPHSIFHSSPTPIDFCTPPIPPIIVVLRDGEKARFGRCITYREDRVSSISPA